VITIRVGDVREQLRQLDAKSAQAVCTSPPYFQLRDYGVAGQIGMEATPAEFVATLVDVFREVRRVMRDDGVLFVNLGRSYGGSVKGNAPGPNSTVGHRWRGSSEQLQRTPGQAKSLLLIPERFAIAMSDDGWIVRDQIVWAKKAPMPESVRDRCTSSWEPIFMFTKQARYFWDAAAVAQTALQPLGQSRLTGSQAKTTAGGFTTNGTGNSTLGTNQGASTANMRNVWHLGPEPSREAHWASFPTEIPRRCILAASRKGDTILDPFVGSGTTLLVADRLERNGIGIDLNPEYAEIARRRCANDAPMFADVTVAG